MSRGEEGGHGDAGPPSPIAVTERETPWKLVSSPLPGEDPASLEVDDIQRLRDNGFDDRSILDINLVVGYYAFVNRLADGLGVPLEDFWD